MSDEPSLSEAQTEDTTENTESVDNSLLTDSESSDADSNTDSDASSSDSTEGNTEGDKADDGGQNGAPEAYADFDLPEGVTMDEALLESALPLFKELNLTQDQAQKLINLQAERVQAGITEQTEAFDQLMNGWREQSKNDKEFGGEKFDESIAVAQRAMDKFGTPELKDLMNDHGVGNHPEMIRFMYKVGRLTTEDNPGGQSNPVSTEASRIQRMYKQ
jgi:hypothetical protein